MVLTYCLDLFPISREFLANILDAIQNENYSKIKLTMPVPAVGAGYIPAFGGDVTINYALYGMQRLAQNVTGVKVPLSGHWIPEERPDFVVNMLNNFFGSANAKK